MPRYPAALTETVGRFPGLVIRRESDLGSCGEQGVKYLLVWETLGPNQDRARQPPLPEPSALRLYKLKARLGRIIPR